MVQPTTQTGWDALMADECARAADDVMNYLRRWDCLKPGVDVKEATKKIAEIILARWMADFDGATNA